jgi:uncharacterized protein YndB with AHSA1/START domain
MNPPNSPSDHEFVVERVFNAPRAVVFDAFSKCEHLTRWWGVQGWTLPVCKLDFRPGGTWLYCMRGPQGEESWGKSVYHEIVQPERIVYTDYFSDKDGNQNEKAPSPLVTLTFVDLGGKTKLVNRAQYGSAKDLETVLNMGMEDGIGETFDRLDALLAELNR